MTAPRSPQPDPTPDARCDGCKRYAWGQAMIGASDHMTQPDGTPCGGTFRAFPTSPDPSEAAVTEGPDPLTKLLERVSRAEQLPQTYTVLPADRSQPGVRMNDDGSVYTEHYYSATLGQDDIDAARAALAQPSAPERPDLTAWTEHHDHCGYRLTATGREAEVVLPREWLGPGCTCGLSAALRAEQVERPSLDVADLHAADMAAWLVEAFVWQQPVLSGTEPPSREQASDALATIRKVIVRLATPDSGAASPAERTRE